ncbi:MAG: 3-dehydroquinate synthase [Anaerolineae bacterium]|nr:3-dehydroquinate synthase [Anaerolineae bacterium]
MHRHHPSQSTTNRRGGHSFMANTLTVQGADGAYPMVIQPGALNKELPQFVIERGFTRTVVVTNTTLAPLYGDALAGRLPGGHLIVLPDGEEFKTLATVETIYTRLLEASADRSTLIVALGGGVIGDMAGFAAATFMRGVALVQAPTSLLAMVDSSIGGKVGVDLPQGKNLVGAFKDPLAVFADTSTLTTLPDVELRCGLAEALKNAIIGDPPLLDHLLARGIEPAEEVIGRAATVKVDIVGEDRLEHGPRAFLNLGHTFGHAIEKVSSYEWKHGQAVAVGIVAAARLSDLHGLCSPELPGMIERVAEASKLPTRCPGLDPADLWDAMQHDKKWHDGAARFILLEGIGKPIIVKDVTRDEVISVIDRLTIDD